MSGAAGTAGPGHAAGHGVGTTQPLTCWPGRWAQVYMPEAAVIGDLRERFGLRLAPFQRRFVRATFRPGVDLSVLSVVRGNGKSWSSGSSRRRAC